MCNVHSVGRHVPANKFPFSIMNFISFSSCDLNFFDASNKNARAMYNNALVALKKCDCPYKIGTKVRSLELFTGFCRAILVGSEKPSFEVAPTPWPRPGVYTPLK